MSPYHYDVLRSPHIGVAAIAAALTDMNAVVLTVEQVEQGDKVYRTTMVSGGWPPHPHDTGMAALLAWCEREGLEPVEAAAYSILYRGGRATSFPENGIMDPAKECPDFYRASILAPLDGWTVIGTNDHPRYAEFADAGLLPA